MKEIIVNDIKVTENGVAWKLNPRSKPLNKRDAVEALSIIKRIFDEKGIKFIFTYGTLLGVIRENDFIKNDIDVDLAMFWYDQDKFYDTLPLLDKEGIKLFRYSKNEVFSFYYKDIPIDIDMIFQGKLLYKFRYYKTLRKLFPKRFVEETEKVSFYGIEFDVPKNPEKFLEYMYGKNWRIPQKGKQARLFPKWMLYEQLMYRFHWKITYIKKKIKKKFA